MDLFGQFTQLIKNLTRNQPSTFFKGFLVCHQWWWDTTACDELDAFDCD